jgi:hypothetical protein
MRRIHLFEFNDLTWFPNTFRRMQTDYLQFVVTLGAGHKNLVPLFQRALQHTGTDQILDLCSGGTGPWLRLQKQLAQAGCPVSIQLSDKYPNPEAMQKWARASRQGIEYLAEPVDARQVPPHLKGMRTMFEGFHHFRPDQARAILQDAVDQRTAIGVFEASLPRPFGLFLLLISPLVTIFSYVLLTPFIAPRKFSRFLWTYLVPIVPLVTCWDGVISLLRVYSPQELKELADSLQAKDYVWEIGLASTGTPMFEFTYLVGYPA